MNVGKSSGTGVLDAIKKAYDEVILALKPKEEGYERLEDLKSKAKRKISKIVK